LSRLRGLEPAKVRDILIVAALLTVITILHYYTDVGASALHILYRRLYYIPIIYGALRFGLRGGLATSLAASILFAPHIVFGLGFEGTLVDNWFEIILFNVVGAVAGSLVEAERRQAINYERVSSQLETAYNKLEDRAIALSALQNYTRSVLESTTSAVLSVDRSLRIQTANRAASEMFGMEEDELIGSDLHVLCREEGDLCGQVRRVVSGERDRVDVEMGLRSAQGRIVPATVSVAPHKDLAGRKIGAVVTVEDLSEIRELTEQLMRADRLAAMGELVAGVAHEVRNPLGTIKASIQLLERENPDMPGLAELAPVMKHEIDRLDRVIKTLLDFGRPAKPVFGKVDLSTLLGDVIIFTGQYAKGARVRIESELPEDLPRVWADEEKLKQVFINLIFNAVQSMPGGGTVAVGGEEEDGFVRVSVTDTGVGMTSDVLAKIWDPFFTTKDEGTGLGLPIVHRIIDEHGGYVSVESEVGKGTSFTVRLPIEPRGNTVEVAQGGQSTAENKDERGERQHGGS